MGSTSINNGSYESLQDSEHDSLSNDTGGSDKSGYGTVENNFIPLSGVNGVFTPGILSLSQEL